MAPNNKQKNTRNRPQGGKPGRGGRPGHPKNRGPQGVQHPGLVLAEVLVETPLPLIAKWFGVSPVEMEAILTGQAPMTPPMADVCGSIFGTGAAPWLEMIKAWDEAQAPKEQQPG